MIFQKRSTYSAYPALNGSVTGSLVVTIGRLAKSCETFSFSAFKLRNSGRPYSYFWGFVLSSLTSVDKTLSTAVSKWDLSRFNMLYAQGFFQNLQLKKKTKKKNPNLNEDLALRYNNLVTYSQYILITTYFNSQLFKVTVI